MAPGLRGEVALARQKIKLKDQVSLTKWSLEEARELLERAGVKP